MRSRNPLNIGAVARAMTNFGPHRLRVVNPYKLAFRDARSAVGAADVLQHAEEFTSVAEAVADCSLVVGTTAVRERSLNQELRQLDQETGSLIRSSLSNTRAAILFGSEKTGLSNDDFSHCHWLLNIPTRQENISMNLGQSVAVCLYELARGSNIKPIDLDPTGENQADPATSEQTQMVTENLFDALKISGYVKPGTGAMFEKKTRQLILRFKMESYDAKLFLGMLRQILWKLRLTPKE